MGIPLYLKESIKSYVQNSILKNESTGLSLLTLSFYSLEEMEYGLSIAETNGWYVQHLSDDLGEYFLELEKGLK